MVFAPLIQCWIAGVAQRLVTLRFEDRTLIKAVKVSWFINVRIEFFNWFMVENPRSHFAVLGDRVIRRSIKTRQSLTSSGGDISILEKTSRVLWIFCLASRWRRMGHWSMIPLFLIICEEMAKVIYQRTDFFIAIGSKVCLILRHLLRIKDCEVTVRLFTKAWEPLVDVGYHFWDERRKAILNRSAWLWQLQFVVVFDSTLEYPSLPIIPLRVRPKWKVQVALWASCSLRLLARRSEELARNQIVYKLIYKHGAIL